MTTASPLYAEYQIAPGTVRVLTENVASAQLIDVSNWQGRFGWATAAKQVPNLACGLFRVTQGLGGAGTNSPDPFAGWNHSNIRDANLYRGGYHFLDPRLPGDKQAEYFLETFDQLGLVKADILACDNEAADGVSPTGVSDCAGAFMATLKKECPNNPRWIYSFEDFILGGNCNGLGAYDLWLAWTRYTAPTAPPPFKTWKGWQWGQRSAAGQSVDADAFNGTVSDFRKYVASFNPGTPKPVDGYYPHFTDGLTSLAGIAATRNETLISFLASQAKAYTTIGEDAQAQLADIGNVVPHAGLVYWTVHPS